jgi:hypothetical protein
MPDKAIEKNKNTKRGLKVAALAGGLVLVGGVAFAYWTQGGTGSGSASTGGTTPITVNQKSSIAGLAPGVGPKTLSGDFDNPNSGPVYVTSVTASISSVVKAAGAPAGTCDATDYTLSNATMAVGAEVPAGTAQGSWTGATLEFNNKSGVNQDACKGATVNLAYTAS